MFIVGFQLLQSYYFNCGFRSLWYVTIAHFRSCEKRPLAHFIPLARILIIKLHTATMSVKLTPETETKLTEHEHRPKPNAKHKANPNHNKTLLHKDTVSGMRGCVCYRKGQLSQRSITITNTNPNVRVAHRPPLKADGRPCYPTIEYRRVSLSLTRQPCIFAIAGLCNSGYNPV